MSTHKLTAALSIFAVNFGCLAAGPNLGKPIDSAEIAAWDISIPPDGTGLPSGSGTPAQGAPLYAQKCAACHGENGKGAVNAAVVGGAELTNGIDTVKTIANFWPYATTLFDFIRRAMPYQQPRTLTNDEVYALTRQVVGMLVAHLAALACGVLVALCLPLQRGLRPTPPCLERIQHHLGGF